MKKEQTFKETRFSAETLKAAIEAFESTAQAKGFVTKVITLTAEVGGAKWSHDDSAEFFADYRKRGNWVQVAIGASGEPADLSIICNGRLTHVRVELPSRGDVETVFDVLERNLASSKLTPLPVNTVPKPKPVVFIGHGRSPAWRDLKDHLHDQHAIEVIAYETGARAGHTIRDVLEEMAGKSTFALLVLTGEDAQEDGGLRARQNVVHETGLFQGRLGFTRAIVVLEDGAEDFSNLAGVQQIRFAKGNIKATFGDVLATLKREFG